MRRDEQVKKWYWNTPGSRHLNTMNDPQKKGREVKKVAKSLRKLEKKIKQKRKLNTEQEREAGDNVSRFFNS